MKPTIMPFGLAGDRRDEFDFIEESKIMSPMHPFSNQISRPSSHQRQAGSDKLIHPPDNSVGLGVSPISKHQRELLQLS